MILHFFKCYFYNIETEARFYKSDHLLGYLQWFQIPCTLSLGL